jgi:hypothetical protein
MDGGMGGMMQYGGGMGDSMGLGGYGGGGMYGGGEEEGGDYGGYDGGYGGGGYGGASEFGPTALSGSDIKSRTEVSATTIHDVPVELYGIIYIYNPVDRSRLGIEESSETAESSSLTGPAQPATGAPG